MRTPRHFILSDAMTPEYEARLRAAEEERDHKDRRYRAIGDLGDRYYATQVELQDVAIPAATAKCDAVDVTVAAARAKCDALDAIRETLMDVYEADPYSRAAREDLDEADAKVHKAREELDITFVKRATANAALNIILDRFEVLSRMRTANSAQTKRALARLDAASVRLAAINAEDPDWRE